jgi:hypothetical protein
MKMMKLGMRSGPLGKTSWETWCLNYQGQRHYLSTIQIIALGPLQYQHWTGPDMRLDIWKHVDETVFDISVKTIDTLFLWRLVGVYLLFTWCLFEMLRVTQNHQFLPEVNYQHGQF